MAEKVFLASKYRSSGGSCSFSPRSRLLFRKFRALRNQVDSVSTRDSRVSTGVENEKDYIQPERPKVVAPALGERKIGPVREPDRLARPVEASVRIRKALRRLSNATVRFRSAKCRPTLPGMSSSILDRMRRIRMHSGCFIAIINTMAEDERAFVEAERWKRDQGPRGVSGGGGNTSGADRCSKCSN